MPTLHVICPPRECVAIYSDWIDAAWALLSALADWAGWKIRCHPTDRRHDFDAQHVHEIIGANPGPVLVVGNLRWTAVQALEERLVLKYAVVKCGTPTELNHVLDMAREAMVRHIDGDPKVQRRFVVALLLLRKLVRYDYWGGGSKNKCYIWPDELAKGRGVDEKYKGDVRDVANTLCNIGLMVAVNKQGSPKYALNRERRGEIHEFLRTRCTSNKTLSANLLNDHRFESARELDILDKDDLD